MEALSALREQDGPAEHRHNFVFAFGPVPQFQGTPPFRLPTFVKVGDQDEPVIQQSITVPGEVDMDAKLAAHRDLVQATASKDRVCHKRLDPGDTTQKLRKFCSVDQVEVALTTRAELRVGASAAFKFVLVVVSDPIFASHATVVERYSVKQGGIKQIVDDDVRERISVVEYGPKHVQSWIGLDRFVQSVVGVALV